MGYVFLRPQWLISCLLVNENIHKMHKKKKKNEKAVTFIKKIPQFCQYSMPALNVMPANLYSNRSRCSIYKPKEEIKCQHFLGSLQNEAGN